MSQLVIVESPAKARTLSRFLGKGYTLKASLGHIRDLPTWKMGLEIENGFLPQYEVIKGKAKVVQEIKQAATKAREVYLATDPDREGEAIAWHLSEVAGLNNGTAPRRVVFHEITEEAVKEAFHHPRPLDMNLVQAQQARRILDRLVGYMLSPLLWKKVGKGLSAGRVQSAALRLVVDREREILAFVPQEYWTIDAEFLKKGATFRARFIGLWGGEKLPLGSQKEAERVVGELKGSSFTVGKVQQRELTRHPSPPFITSTLQQDAYRKVGFAAEYTMRLAQQLYEGLEVGPEGAVGLITYMRTDSTRVAPSALSETRDYISAKFGPDYLPAKARVFARQVKGAQEAHEAIRPTRIAREPDSLRPYLNADQLRLYELIWKRLVASQMSPARYDTTTVDIEARPPGGDAYLLRASGSVLRFPGFTRLYMESQEEPEEAPPPLPPLKVGERLKPQGFFPQQHFTQPPPRYNEATLIRALEERGIGRPSTYAPIVSTLKERAYVRRDSGRLVPQEVGLIVADLLRDRFPDVVELNFTAQMEERLDAIARGEAEWQPVISAFYTPFYESVKRALGVQETGEVCPDCGRPLTVKQGRYGPFVACSGYPECRYKPAIKAETGRPPEPQETGEPCPECGQPLTVKQSRYGPFVACSGYPKCRYKRIIQAESGQPPEPQEELGPCPQCGKPLVTRRSRFGPFLACSGYPQCRYKQAAKGKATPAPEAQETGEPCPQCGKPLVTRRSRFGQFFSCSGYPECTYKRPYILKTGAACPECGGELGERVSKRGKTFFGCLNYPRCRFATPYRPLPQPCPQCGGLLVTRGRGAYCLKEEHRVDLTTVEVG